mgnify:CR=1 FL=1
MKKLDLRKLTLNAMMIAMVLLVTYLTPFKIIPQGYINLGDIAIFIAAIVLGRKSGFIAGAIGSSLADIALGYVFYAPTTFLVKGMEGYIAGLIGYAFKYEKVSYASVVIGVIAGAVWMVLGYFVSEAFILNYFVPGFGLATALNNVLGNLIQAAISAIAAPVIFAYLVKFTRLRSFVE